MDMYTLVVDLRAKVAMDFKPNPLMSGKRFPIEKTCFDNEYDIPYVTDFKE